MPTATSRLHVGLAGAVVALAASLVHGADGRLALTGPPELVACAPIDGRFVGFVTPAGHLALLAATPFPGGEAWSVGAAGEVQVPGVGAVELASPPAQVWGLVDRSLGAAGRGGCVAFDKDRFTWESDLLTYVHWMFRDVLFRLPAAGAAPRLVVGDRQVVLEVASPGLRPLELAGTEGGVIGLRLPHSQARYLFLPLVLDEALGRIAVKVLDPAGAVFDAESARELAFVEASYAAPAETPTQPPFTIRVVAVGTTGG